MGSISASIRRFDSLSPSVEFPDLQLVVDIGDDDVDMFYIDDDGGGGGDDMGEEFLCPFCADHYDVVVLRSHIDDQHPLHAHNGVCPLCENNVAADFVGHITKEHGNFLKMQQRNRRFRKENPSNAMLRKELEVALEKLESLDGGGSSCLASSSCEPDPLLFPFTFNPVVADEPPSSLKDFLGRKPEQLRRLDLYKDQVEEDARRFEFLQGLLMSTVLDDNL